MPVAVLVVGGGSIGERHVRCFQQIGCDVALCEADKSRREELGTRYKLARSFAQPADAVNQPWHGVIIASPAELHLAHVTAVAGATTALLLENPLCTRLEEVALLRQLTREKVVQIGYVLRVHPAVQRVRELLSEGTIGPLDELTITAGHHFPAFRQAPGAAPTEDRAGAIQEAAGHLLDLVAYFTDPLEWIFCDMAHLAKDGGGVEDTVHLVGRAARGRVLVSLALNQRMVPNEAHVQLNGERGSLAIRLHDHRAGVLLRGDADWAWGEPLVASSDDLFRLQAQRFLAAAVGQEPPHCTFDDGVQGLLVNLAALRSGQSQTVEFITQS